MQLSSDYDESAGSMSELPALSFLAQFTYEKPKVKHYGAHD